MTKDIHLYESGSGGELNIVNNDIQLVETLFQQVYLCLFGGNVEASTKGNELSGEVRNDWWGNSLLFSEQPQKQFNSETERVINETVLNSSGRIKIQRAVESDLSFFGNTAKSEVVVTILNHDSVQVFVKLTRLIDQQEINLKIIWDNAKNEVIIQKTI